MKKLALGCDHVGFIIKDEIIQHLQQMGVEVVDKGTWSDERTDYPAWASAVATAILAKEVEGGILICGTGVGISITANKHPGIRAVVCSEPYSAQLSRQHNDTNVLAFGSRVVGPELAKMMVDAWLAADFEGGRHQRRVAAITDGGGALQPEMKGSFMRMLPHRCRQKNVGADRHEPFFFLSRAGEEL